MSPTQNPDLAISQNTLNTMNLGLKVVSKRILRNDKLILLLKAAKIAFESRTGKASDPIFPLLPEIIINPNPVIIDVGANMGQFASRVARQFPTGRIYSFEPIHASAVGLQRVLRWLRISNVEIFEQAICDKMGTERIHIPNFSGYQDGTLAVLEGSKHAFSNVTYQVETTQTNTLDAFAAVREIKRLDFLKVDTEGAEERVVHGAMQTILTLLPTLYMEAAPDQFWLQDLYSEGYQPFYTDGVRLHSPRRGERQNDILLVHSSMIERIATLIKT